MTNNLDILKKIMLVGIGATAATLERFQGVIDELVEKGEMTKEQALKFNEDLKEKAKHEKESFEKKVQDTIKDNLSKILKEIGIPTTKDLHDLESRIEEKLSRKVDKE